MYVRYLCSLALISLFSTTASAGSNYQDVWNELQRELQVQLTHSPAKNIILFVGDGMGVSTVTAARILEGQNRGVDGEGNLLSFERFPFIALSKTYSADQQTPDSAPTMSAMVTGYKTNGGVFGVNDTVIRGERSWDRIQKNSVKNIFEVAEEVGMATGVVSTARITHATPGACYAHTSNRDWESDADVPQESNVPDIARQLIEFPFGDGIDVVFGGGARAFIPKESSKYFSEGRRKDGRDLISEWLNKSSGSRFLHTKEELENLDSSSLVPTLGLFSSSHMAYSVDRGAGGDSTQPSLVDMTRAAIKLLSNHSSGYVLSVEAGRIDHGHHAGNAFRALHDAIELSDAVEEAVRLVDLNETLIIVTADHSHVMTLAGYPKRGNPILGKVIHSGESAPVLAKDGLPYTTIGYMNGRGFHDLEEGGDEVYKEEIFLGRKDLTDIDSESPGFHQESLVPLDMETHGGEDVAIYAVGPMAHLFRGVKEQNYIFHVMRYALGEK